MTTDSIKRVRYFDRQFLRTTDFATEQAYHVGMRRRHNIAHHYWGIVAGLELAADESGLHVLPGMAVDGYGRELVLPLRQPLSTSEFSARARDELDVWLLYSRRGSDRPPKGYQRCGESASEYYRWSEVPVIRLDVPEPGGTRARQPAAVPREVLDNFGPHLQPPDDPGQAWPVYLGRILRDNTDPANPVYSVDMTGRPYAGLVGEAVKSPSGMAALLLGQEIRSDETGRQRVETGRFSVVLRDDACHEREALRIDADGEITVRGKARVHGDVQLDQGAVEFHAGSGTAVSCNDTVPGGMSSGPRPWRMYRHRCSGEGGSVTDQLRLEISPADGASGEIVIGAWSPDEEQFKPILTIGNDSKVTVHGDLVVTGKAIGETTVTEPIAPVRMTDEAENFLLASYAGGIGGANLQIGKFYQSPFGEAVDLNTPEGIANAIDYISADATRLAALIDTLDENTVVRQEFVTRIMGDDSGRRLAMEQLVLNPSARNGFALLLQADIYADVLPPFAVNMVATIEGRQAIMDSLPSASSSLRTFADLLTDARYLDRTDEFAAAIAASNDGRIAFMDGLTAGSAGLTDFANLLRDSTYFDRLSAFAWAVMATEQGQRAVLEHGMPRHSSELIDFAILMREYYPDWLARMLENIALNDTGAEYVAAGLLATARGRAAAVRDLLAEYPRLLDVVTRILDEQAGRKATMESLDNGDPADTDTEARRNQFSNLDWIDLGHSPATKSDWENHYKQFTILMRSRIC